MKTSRFRKATLPPLAAFLALTALSACAKKQPPRAETIPVTIATVVKKEMPVEVTAIGHVEAYNAVSVKPRVNGEIIRVAFRDGQDVAKGDVLLQLDPRPSQSELAQARANLERDRARQKNAEADAKRYAELIGKDYVTRAQYDEALSNAAAAKATVAADEAAVENARLNLEYTTITSPIAGRTGNLLVQVGNMVKAMDDKALVTINQIEPIYVSFSVAESDLPRIRAAAARHTLQTRASPAADPTAVSQGTLTFINNSVDTATGMILLKGTFSNANRPLWPGQFANVALTLAVDPGALVVPSQAIQRGQSGDYVFVVKSDQTVESRPVGVARTAGPVAIIGKGLSAGERVVTDGQLRLAPGAKVDIKATEEVRS
jgi:multidrug efflux system membrane fusion protein